MAEAGEAKTPPGSGFGRSAAEATPQAVRGQRPRMKCRVLTWHFTIPPPPPLKKGSPREPFFNGESR